MPVSKRKQYSAQISKFPHSSDTELCQTPPRKRLRVEGVEDSPTSSCSSRSSPRKRQKRDTPKKPCQEKDLERILRLIAGHPKDPEAVEKLKSVPRDDHSVRLLVKGLFYSAKHTLVQRFKEKEGKLLETELYLEWLNELDYAVSAVDSALNCKKPGTRRRLDNLGQISYTILYNLVDEFIDEVNAHHDGPYPSSSEPWLYPPTMTLVEESKDPLTDDRSEEAVRLAEQALKKIDNVFASAVKRYKAERGWNNVPLANRISAQEHALAKGCCLLCEQTGYGVAEDDMGDTLMAHARELMEQWKNEYEDELDDSDSDSKL